MCGGVRVDQRGLSPELLEMVCFFNKAVFIELYMYDLFTFMCIVI